MESIKLRRKSVNKPPLPTTKVGLKALFSKCLDEIKGSLENNKFAAVHQGSEWGCKANMDSKKPSMTLEVRNYGFWGYENAEDANIPEMSEASFDVVVDKVMAIHKLYPNLRLHINTSENNWLHIIVQ